ncbi:DUF3192 domain-containing protein [Shewanella sp. GXUN23E]|uniref:DUF3192 domain-containing protein n=1 Tax=Shewanella sp. GXUN23E TaxID=3422498 RepID=UPI003D7EC3CA
MKVNAPVVIGSLVAVYLVFVAVVMITHDTSPNSMDWDDRQVYNLQTISTLNLGQAKAEVMELLGKADFSEAKQGTQGPLTVLFYRTHRKNSDGETTRDECTPLLFRNDRLVAWGIDTYEQYVSSSANEL